LIDIDQFEAVDMRVGRIVALEEFPEARRPAWKLSLDFGPDPARGVVLLDLDGEVGLGSRITWATRAR
jgi:tRNA-binding EMAP/Myf-like protein